MEQLVILSGAGISAESGLKTFRDSDGLWENYKIEDVATPQAWLKNRELVLKFYNERRVQVRRATPNPAHRALVELEKKYHVQIITQNIDDLHERAGSKNVLHLHGEIVQSRSTIDSSLVYPISGEELNLGEVCEKGSQLRPNIVWFGEMVPALDEAIKIVTNCDILIIVGTSLVVYPAAGLLNYAPFKAIKYLVDPDTTNASLKGIQFIQNTAGKGIPALVKQLLQ